MAAKIKLALDILSNEVRHIDTVPSGLKCNCKCPKCGERLVAKKGRIRQKHFSHPSGRNCTGNQETTLHKFGIKVLLDNNQIVIPTYGTIDYVSPEKGKKFGNFQPDVIADYNGEKIFFELAVTHFMEPAKCKFFNDGRHKCVEIDLSSRYALSEKEIEQKVLRDTFNKTLYGWEAVLDTPNETLHGSEGGDQ